MSMNWLLAWFRTGVRSVHDALLPLRSKGERGEGEGFVPEKQNPVDVFINTDSSHSL
jgi:hypothetical protein